MKIVGAENMTVDEVQHEVDRGARFVLYQYTISVLILTFRRPSHVYFVRGGQSRLGKGLLYSLVTLLFGWWGFPWGPIYTVGSLVTNFGGGKDVTTELMAQFGRPVSTVSPPPLR